MYASQPIDRTITVTLADGARTDATVTGTHPASAHAVRRLRVPAATLVAPRPGASVSPPCFGVSLTGAGVVAAVEPGSPAAAAGLRQGDDITAIGGQAVSGARAVGAAVSAHAVGDPVDVTVNRIGEKLRFTVTLAARAA